MILAGKIRQWYINVVDYRKLHAKKKKMQRCKADFVFYLRLFYSFAALL